MQLYFTLRAIAMHEIPEESKRTFDDKK